MSGTLYILMARGCGGCSHFKTHSREILLGYLEKQQKLLESQGKLSFDIVEIEAPNMKRGLSTEQLAEAPDSVKSHSGDDAWWPAFYWVPTGSDHDASKSDVLFATWNPMSKRFMINPHEMKLPTNTDIGDWLRRKNIFGTGTREPTVRYRGSTPNQNRYRY